MAGFRDSVVQIIEQSLLDNMSIYKQRLKNKQAIILILKANAYGAGCVRVAEIFESENAVEYYAVASIDEGLELRNAGIKKPIMILNMDIGLFDQAIDYNLEPVLINPAYTKALISVSRNTNKQINVHINLDTGMHRVGYKPDEIEFLGAQLNENPNLCVKSIFSHYVASGNEAFDYYSLKQLDEFNALAKSLTSIVKTDAKLHMANTGAAERFVHENLALQRIGIGMYGIAATHIHLENVFSWKTKVAHIQSIEPGETVSYNRTWTAERTSKIATVFVGYADGLNRKLSNGNWSLKWNGKALPIVGDICMDLCMIDATGYDVQIGDELTILGSIKDIRKMCGVIDTIPYEILTSISPRINRVYV